MRKRAMHALIVASVGALALAWGCRSARRSEPIAGPITFAERSPKGQAAIRGQRVFMLHCYQCHPAGEAGVGPALNDKLLPGFAIRTQVRRGYGAMPAFSQREIAGPELDDLVEYLTELRHN